MSYDRESFIQSFVSFLPKNINELESRLNQMREDMEQAVQALIQNQKGTQPTYIDLGKGKCGSTIGVSTGCGNLLLSHGKELAVLIVQSKNFLILFKHLKIA